MSRVETRHQQTAAPSGQVATEPCAVIDCERKQFARGLCQMHWKRVHDGRPLLAPIRMHHAGQIHTCVICGAQWCQMPGHASYRRRTCSSTCHSQLITQAAQQRRDSKRDAEIVELARQGIPHRTIGEQFGIGGARVGQIATAAGIYRRRQPSEPGT